MKILFLESHPMWIHGLPNGFRDLGHEVKISGELTETNIPVMISEFKPDLIITIGWTPENTGEKPDWIRKYVKPLNIPHVYWATEDPGFTDSFTIPLIRRTLPDFVFTICQEKIDYYKKLGVKAASMGFGYHDSVHKRVDPDPNYKCSLAVVANSYPRFIEQFPECFRVKSMRTILIPLLKAGMRVDFWGRYWDQMEPHLGFRIPPEWIHGYLDYAEVHKVYSSADIVIGLQNRQVAQRTFEILGSEGFMLTNDTDAIKQFFTHKKDLIISSSPQETLELVNYYLNNPAERERIRKQGKLSVAKYSYEHNARYILDVLREYKILPYT